MFNFGKSSGRTSSDSFVWGQQSPFLMDLYSRGQAALNQFQPNEQMGQQAMNAWQQQLNPQVNPYLNQMTDIYRQQLGQLDQQTGVGAVGGGVYGGGRQGVEQYLNQRNVGNQLGQFLGNQYQQDMNRAQGALSMTPMLMQQVSPYGQQMSALQQYAGLIGPPQVLSRSRGRTSSMNFGLSDFGGYALMGGGF